MSSATWAWKGKVGQPVRSGVVVRLAEGRTRKGLSEDGDWMAWIGGRDMAWHAKVKRRAEMR